MQTALKTICRFLIALSLCSGGMAQVIPWQLEGTFEDAATVTGRIDYNPDSEVFSNISFDTGPGAFAFGTELLGHSFRNITSVTPETAFGLRFQELEPLGGDVQNIFTLWLDNFDPGIPTAQMAALLESALFSLNAPGKPSGIAQSRFGQGFVQVIPEPAIHALMLAGLGLVGGLAALRNKQEGRIAVANC